MHLFNLRAQGIEIQFLKPLNTLRTFENSPVGMTDSTNSVLRYLKHILFVKVRLQQTHLADHYYTRDYLSTIFT